MGIRNRLTFFIFAVTLFLTSAAGTASAGDGAERGTSPNDGSIRVVLPDKSAESPAIKHTSSLSYGLDVLKRARKLKKTSTAGNIRFSADDFEPFAGGRTVNTVTLLTLPDPSEGTLKLGALDAFPGQTLTPSLIGRVEFVPAYKGASAEFSFSVNGDDAVTCLLYSRKYENAPPEADSVRVYTKCGVTAFSSLDVNDPDGDATEISVVSQPRRGVVKMMPDGSFTYTPKSGFIGRDSFVCRVSDEYGAESDPVTVSVRVERSAADVRYTDVAGTPAEYPAYLLAERGILVGEKVGDTCSFRPDMTVSRADFIVMAMKAAGYSPNVYAGKTENELLTRTQRGYIVTAMSAGILDGAAADNGVITVREAAAITERLGGKNACHDGADVPLTRADAAVMLASIVDALR